MQKNKKIYWDEKICMAVITDITLEYPIYIRGFKEKGNLEKTENFRKKHLHIQKYGWKII